MLKWFTKISKTSDLKDALNKTKILKIENVYFEIKKIDVLNYLDGSNALQENYAVYSRDKKVQVTANTSKVKGHYRDVIMAGVVSPELSRKPDDILGAIFIDDLFVNWTIVQELYDGIIEYTYGKKKDL